MNDRPTHTRYIVAAWLCGLAAVLYLDRICMAQALKPIRESLSLSNTQMSYVHIAFTLAYGLFEIPTGRLGDRFGSRRVITRIVVWWSLFTALTGAATGFYMLLAIRFLFGAGEAGAFPNAARVLARWFPATERGRVQGIMLTCSQLGAVAAPPGAAYLIDTVGWRWAFAVFGLLGIVWAAGFWWWFRDDPAGHPGVNAAEVDVIRAGAAPPAALVEPIPWRAVLRNTGIGLLGSIMICSAFNAYLYYSWFSTYMQDARHVSNIDAGWLNALVLAGSAIGVLSGGVLADWLVRSAGSVVARRRIVGGLCYLVGAGALFGAVRVDDPWGMAALAALSSLSIHLTLPTWWSAAIEQSGKHIGALFGLMNMMGVVGAMASQWFVGAFSDWRASLGYSGREQWDPIFSVYVGVLACGALFWLLYHKRDLRDDRESSG